MKIIIKIYRFLISILTTIIYVVAGFLLALNALLEISSGKYDGYFEIFKSAIKKGKEII